jgi:hypothetical protein
LATDFKSQEGVKSRVYKEAVNRERLEKFCHAVEQKGPSALPIDAAPPTFMTVFRKGEFEVFDLLGLKLESVLHAEQIYQYESDIGVGDEIEFQTQLSHVLEKKGGALSFLTLETKFSTGPRQIGSSRTTIVVKGKVSS